MNEETFVKLKQENARLEADNEVLLDIIAQMKITLNRLINRYMTQER